MIKMMKELKRHEIMRRIEQQDGEQEQYLYSFRFKPQQITVLSNI